MHADVVSFRVSLAPQFADHLAVYQHMPRRNEFFCLAPRSDSGSSDDLLQALSRHSVMAFDPRWRSFCDDHSSRALADFSISSDSEFLASPVRVLGSRYRPSLSSAVPPSDSAAMLEASAAAISV